MPTPCYISITGQTQGNITAGAFTADSVGNIYVQGHEDEMLVQEFLHNVTVPTDPQSGQPAGQRAHKPFIFTVALNKAVPLMYNALASGEMLPTTELHWWRTSVEGKQEHYFTTVRYLPESFEIPWNPNTRTEVSTLCISQFRYSAQSIFLNGTHIHLEGESDVNGDAPVINWNCGATQPVPDAPVPKDLPPGMPDMRQF